MKVNTRCPTHRLHNKISEIPTTRYRNLVVELKKEKKDVSEALLKLQKLKCLLGDAGQAIPAGEVAGANGVGKSAEPPVIKGRRILKILAPILHVVVVRSVR